MQIRLVHQASPGGYPHHTLRDGETRPGTEVDRANLQAANAAGTAGNTELDQLTRQLDEFSAVRGDVVAEAKVRVQRGDYLNHAAAGMIADALLRTDAWSDLSVTD